MMLDIILRGYKLHYVEQYANNRASMTLTIKRLKFIALAQTFEELGGVSWVIYGFSIYYSVENQCNWETKHSFGYILMFLMLTLGMILLVKWLFKAMIIAAITLKTLLHTIFGTLMFFSRRLHMNQSVPYRQRILNHLLPDIYAVSDILQMRRLQERTHLYGSIQKLFFKVKKLKVADLTPQ